VDDHGTSMRPTRICNWPPRLDVELRAHVRPPRHRRERPRCAHPAHPLVRASARGRWTGRAARQRRFAGAAVRTTP